jgi:dTDP-glucose 4,6-dehydratase
LRFLISGAAGFVGSHLCERLLNDGHEVAGFDNFITGAADNIRHLKGNHRFAFFEHDVTAPLPEMGRFDGVMHLASLASPKFYYAYPIETLESGSTGTRNMLEVARRHEARFLVTSTSECYGDPEIHPQLGQCQSRGNPVLL